MADHKLPPELQVDLDHFEEAARVAEATKDPKAEAWCDQQRAVLKAAILEYISNGKTGA